MSRALTTSNKNVSQAKAQEEEDDDLVILPDVDNSELIARYKLSLVGRLFNRERRSVEALIALLPRPSIWDVEGRVRGVDLGNHRFQFDFDSEEDLQKVLSKRPCHYNKWSFALERWAPHIGDSFPNTMTFWVTAMGIPTHFWLEPIFRALGQRLGQVGPVEAKAAKFQVELNAERPLKFSLRAQLPSGEIVPVSLEYVNLHRWCHSCHLISHEDETCPTLTEAEREQHRLAKETNRDQGQQPRMEANRNGDLSKRLSVAALKAPRPNERSSGEGTQRDNRDSVWKRMDSRYAPRDESREINRHGHRDENRESTRHVSRDRDAVPPSKETYNKRRYEVSFAASRHREEARRMERKHIPSSRSSKGETAPEESRENHIAQASHSSKGERASAGLILSAPAHPSLAKQINSSPEHVRERPFRLALQKKDTSDLKLKGKEGDLGESYESVSSAQKSLRFAEENKTSPPKNQIPLPPVSIEESKKKSWYELTVEEEEEAGKQDSEADAGLTHQVSNEKTHEVEDPNGEKILEEEDWMVEGDNFDDDDLLEEEEMLYEENQEEAEEVAPPMVPEDLPLSGKGLMEPGGNSEKGRAEEIKHRPEAVFFASGSNLDSPANTLPLQSPYKKKKDSPIPIAAGLSLRKRNLLMGRVSPKFKEAKDGPNLGSSSASNRLDKSHGGGKDDTLVRSKNKNAKVGSKPPKIPK